MTFAHYPMMWGRHYCYQETFIMSNNNFSQEPISGYHGGTPDRASSPERRAKNAQYYQALQKAVAAFLSAVPEDQRRGIASGALRMTSELDSPETKRFGSSLVFPVLAIPDDATVKATVDLISGMGAVILSVGQAKPNSTIREVMNTADVMMGKSVGAFSGDPNGMGLPIASAIAAAASADPEIVRDAEAAGLNKIIAEVAAMYDCVGHEGPLGMVHIPEHGTPLKGSLVDLVTGLFSNKTATERVSDKADRKMDRLSGKGEKLDAKISNIQAELENCKAQLAATADPKQRKKLQKKIEKLEKKLGRKETKLSKVQDKFEQWKDLSHIVNPKEEDGADSSTTTTTDDVEPVEPDVRRQNGIDALDSDAGSSIMLASQKLQAAGIPTTTANILAGYLIPAGVNDPLSYLSKLSGSIGLSLNDTARYAVYVASGLEPSEALDVIKGHDLPPMDLREYLDDARAKNQAYRTALQQQMQRLKDVNETAVAANRMFTRSEWADAIMSSSDEVADWLRQVSPDASSTQSMLSSLMGLVAAVRTLGVSSPTLQAAIHNGVSRGTISPEAAWMMTGDPTLVPAMVVAVPSGGPEINSQPGDKTREVEPSSSSVSSGIDTVQSSQVPQANPVVAKFDALW